MARTYFLTPWRWDAAAFDGEGAWLRPVGAICAVDFRPLSAMAEAGGSPQGWCFAGFADEPADTSGWIKVGTDLQGVPNTADVKAALETENIEADTVLDALWEIMTVQADPDGLVRAKPLIPTVQGNLDLHLANHSLVKQERFRWGEHPATSKVQAVLQANYRSIRAESRSRGDREHYRRVLDFQAKKYRTDYRNFIPPDLPDEGRLPHNTTITESFDQANSTTLGPDLTWTETSGDLETISNQVEEVGNDGFGEARAESALSSDDHYSQIDHITGSGTGQADEARVLCRFAPGARTHYGYISAGAANSNEAAFKRLMGTFTGIGTDTQVNNIGSTIKVQSDGSTITVYVDDVEQESISDTSISGNTRCGIACREGGIGDNFEAGDLAVGATFEESISLGLSAGVSSAANQDFDATISLTMNADVSDQENTDMAAAMSLAQTLGVSATAAATFEGAMTVTPQLGVATSSLVSFEHAISLTQALGIAASSDQTVEGTISLSTAHGASTQADATFEAAVSLASSLGISTAGGQAFTDTIAVAFSNGVSTAVDLELSGEITLPATFLAQTSALQIFQVSTTVAVQMAVATLSNAIMEAGISVGAVASMSITSESVVADLNTPDGRKLTVSVSTRTLNISSSRTFKPDDQ